MRYAILLLGFASIAASKPEYPASFSEQPVTVAQASYTIPAHSSVDPMAVGGLIVEDQKTLWRELRRIYKTCPSCLETQAFPGDEEESVKK